MASDILDSDCRATNFSSDKSEEVVPQTQEPKETKETGKWRPHFSGVEIMSCDFCSLSLSHLRFFEGGGIQ
jgi:hypothetical protein